MKESTTSRLRQCWFAAWMVIFGGSSVQILEAQCTLIGEDQRIAWDTARHSDEIGRSIAMSGEHLWLGAENGISWAYRHDGQQWTQTARFVHEEDEPAVVDVDGSLAVVGLRGHDQGNGLVEVYRWDGTTWNLEAELGPGISGTTLFGDSVSVAGNVLVVGATHQSVSGLQAGAAHVFRVQGTEWTHEETLVDPDGEHGDRFGDAVTVDGDVIAVGASKSNALKGGVSLWRFDGSAWVYEKEIVGSLPPFNDFAVAIELEGGELWVGVGHDDLMAFNAGSVYRYEDSIGWPEVGRLYSTDPQEGAEWGHSMQRDGDRAVIGAPGWTDATDDRGAVDVLRRIAGQWVEEQRLTMSGAQTRDRLGEGVALAGTRLAGSAPNGDPQGVAAAFEFDGTDWTNEQRVEPRDAHQTSLGSAVAIKSGVGLVATHPARDAGWVRVLRHDGVRWVDDAELHAADPRDGLRFGAAVAVEPPWAFVGAPDCDGGMHAGSVSVFRHDGVRWDPAQLLEVADGLDGDDFGADVSIQGDLLCVGAPGRNEGGTEAGAVFVYREIAGVWAMEAKLVPTTPGAEDRFGESVHLDGDVIVVGAPFDDDVAVNAGSVRAFRWNGASWDEEATLTLADSKPLDHFGERVRVSGSVLAVGVPDLDGLGRSAGAVVVFRHDGGQWNREATITDRELGEQANHRFGHSIDLEGSVLSVGIPGFRKDSGTAALFRNERGRWSFFRRIRPSQGGAFGEAHSMDGEQLLVGAPALRNAERAPVGAVYAAHGGRMALDVAPNPVESDQLLRFLSCGGAPFGIAVLVLVEANGVDRFVPVATGQFDVVTLDEGAWLLDRPVPGGFAGTRLRFQTFGDAVGGGAGFTNRVEVEFR